MLTFTCINIRTKHCDIYRVKGETEVAGIKVFSVKSSCKEKKVEVLWNSGFFFKFSFRISYACVFEVPLSKALDPPGPLNVIFGSFSKQTLKNEKLNPDSCLFGGKNKRH